MDGGNSKVYFKDTHQNYSLTLMIRISVTLNALFLNKLVIKIWLIQAFQRAMNDAPFGALFAEYHQFKLFQKFFEDPVLELIF
jgi:hypothetical protein